MWLKGNRNRRFCRMIHANTFDTNKVSHLKIHFESAHWNIAIIIVVVVIGCCFRGHKKCCQFNSLKRLFEQQDWKLTYNKDPKRARIAKRKYDRIDVTCDKFKVWYRSIYFVVEWRRSYVFCKTARRIQNELDGNVICGNGEKRNESEENRELRRSCWASSSNSGRIFSLPYMKNIVVHTHAKLSLSGKWKR